MHLGNSTVEQGDTSKGVNHNLPIISYGDDSDGKYDFHKVSSSECDWLNGFVTEILVKYIVLNN